MSAHNIFQRALQHAQLTRPPDDYYDSTAYDQQLHEQHDALPVDDHVLVTILLWYGIPMEAGIFICENHPQLAAKINLTLAAGLGPLGTSRPKPKRDTIQAEPRHQPYPGCNGRNRDP